jgi:hypothetical protein
MVGTPWGKNWPPVESLDRKKTYRTFPTVVTVYSIADLCNEYSFSGPVFS